MASFKVLYIIVALTIVLNTPLIDALFVPYQTYNQHERRVAMSPENIETSEDSMDETSRNFHQHVSKDRIKLTPYEPLERKMTLEAENENTRYFDQRVSEDQVKFTPHKPLERKLALMVESDETSEATMYGTSKMFKVNAFPRPKYDMRSLNNDNFDEDSVNKIFKQL